MSRLTGWLRGEKRPPKMDDTYLGYHTLGPGAGGAPSGIVIDGVVWELEGQPPTAQSHGWGDMSWLHRRR